MKDNFYRNRMIIRLSPYGIAVIIALIVHFNATGLFSIVAFPITCAVTFPFASLIATLSSLICEISKKRESNHAVSIATVVLSVVSVIWEIAFWGRDLVYFLIPVGVIWVLWLIEFLVRKIKEQKEINFVVTDRHFVRNKWIFIAVVYLLLTPVALCIVTRSFDVLNPTYWNWNYIIPVIFATLFISAVTLVWELSTRVKENHLLSSAAVIASAAAVILEIYENKYSHFENYLPLYILLIALALSFHVADLIVRKKGKTIVRKTTDKFFINRFIFTIAAYILGEALTLLIVFLANGGAVERRMYLIRAVEALPFITLCITIASLAVEHARKEKLGYIFSIVEASFAIASSVVAALAVPQPINSLYVLYMPFTGAVWILWLAEFIVRKKKQFSIKEDKKEPQSQS